MQLDDADAAALYAAIPLLLNRPAGIRDVAQDTAALNRLFRRLQEENETARWSERVQRAAHVMIQSTPVTPTSRQSRVDFNPSPPYQIPSPSWSPQLQSLLPRAPALFSNLMMTVPSPDAPATPSRGPPGLLPPFELGSPGPASPTSTVVGSEYGLSPAKDKPAVDPSLDSGCSSELRKRSAADAGLDELEGPRRSRRLCEKDREAGNKQRAGDEEGGGGGGHPHSKGACPRRGDRARVSQHASRQQIAASVQAIRGQLERGELGSTAAARSEGRRGGGKKSKVAKATVWTVNGEVPYASRDSALRIVQFSMITVSGDLQNRLARLILDLPQAQAQSDPSETTPSASLQSPSFSPLPSSETAPPSISSIAILRHCAALEDKQVVLDFQIMMSYIQSALYIQWRTTKATGAERPSYAQLAKEVAVKGVNQSRIQHWYNFGSRLIYLAAASSMYIIPMIAVCGLRVQLCKMEDVELIERLGYLLCAPHPIDHQHTLSKDCGDIIRSLIVPQMVFIKQVSTMLENTFCLEFPPDAAGNVQTIRFSEVQKMSARLREFDYNFFKLPDLDSCWEALESPVLAPMLPMTPNIVNIPDDCVAEEVTIHTDFQLRPTPCPVNPDNSSTWTQDERDKADKAYVVKDVEDLENKLKTFYANGDKSEDAYLCVPTENLGGKVVTLRDSNNKRMATVITNMAEVFPHLEASAMTLISAILEGEVYPVDSTVPMFKYCSTHKVWYNRYAEQGDDAPKGVHPHEVCKEGVSRTNHGQRAAHPSKEMRDDPLETELLAEFLNCIVVFVEKHLIKLSPDEHYKISIFANRLPLNERSPAHPFAGFVLNVGVSTWGHRDGGDKEFCVTIPAGDFKGAALGLYEPGLLFRLRPWDVIIFPSCDITHFNTHVQGTRISIVFHTDKAGDGWSKNQNGWKE
ncbi:hypothetical protein C8R47DRAFT_1168442 [Mycena vitilis]|nr:hypothetical protein C8R47DRAFT_1168442 [Mycena vitilis]